MNIDTSELNRVRAAAGATPALRIGIGQLVKRFGERQVLHGLDLDIDSGQFVAIVGRSGCGKSTLLRLLAGLDEASGGDILLDGRAERDLIGDVRMMFQDARLLPWRTVIQNVALGLA
ncbi:ATP-binding cassette domain-containing protein, partial [Stutzerimonas kunmingensis]|uniref:ATP-binding cassette domain-containing protein n=1 Tax=Stutzerimonas kunmingensis TaxID=1211807 RepID=UPI0035B4844D